jgi:type IV pilus assembly protein PilM
MIPWNPIHRYAGMTSLFDSIDEQDQRDATVARFESPGEAPQPTPDSIERAPLGFVDVRAEAGAGAEQAPDVETGHTEVQAAAEHVADETPTVELAPVEPVAAAASDEDEQVPFYKREISFGRKSKERPTANDEKAEKTPFYKREISFKRSGSEESPVEPELEPEAELAPVIELAPVAAVEPEPVVVPEVEAPAPVEEPAVVLQAVEPEGEQIDWPADDVSDEVVEVTEEPVEEPAPVELVATEAVEPEPVAAPEPVLEPAAPAEEPAVVMTMTEAPAKRDSSRAKQSKPKSSRNGRGNKKSGRKIVGLKIGASQLAAAVVQEHDGRHELVELARTPLEPGIVVDGEVRDHESLVDALRAFFADQKLPTRDVRIGIASNRIGVRTIELAGIDDEARFDNAVRFKAHEVLPIAVSDSVLDYRVLDERVTDAGETAQRVLLVVAPRDQVAPYVDVAQRAGLKLAGIDLEALGLLRTFVPPSAGRVAGDTATVVVSIGHEASTLLVSGGGICEFTRVFDWGGFTLQEAIAQELQLHPAEAATILRHLSLAGASPRVEGIDEEAKSRALEAVRLRLTPFARELVSSLQFYQTQPDSLGIGEIVITGGTSQLDGLADALHQMIGVNVRVGDPLGRVVLRKGVESGFEQSLGSLAVPIGLAIDDDARRGVDLIPRDIAKATRGSRNLLPVLLPAAAVVPIAALGFVFAQTHSKVSDRHDKLSAAQTTLASLPQPKGPQIDPGLAADEAARASAVAQVLGGRTSWDGMLRDLSRVLPEKVWLTNLHATVPSPLSAVLVGTAAPVASTTGTAPAAPTGVTIKGYTYKQADVAVLLARLVALPSFQNVQLQSSTVSQVADKDVVSFTILADLGGAGGGA